MNGYVAEKYATAKMVEQYREYPSSDWDHSLIGNLALATH
jgi:hypothetical protein